MQNRFAASRELAMGFSHGPPWDFGFSSVPSVRAFGLIPDVMRLLRHDASVCGALSCGFLYLWLVQHGSGLGTVRATDASGHG